MLFDEPTLYSYYMYLHHFRRQKIGNHLTLLVMMSWGRGRHLCSIFCWRYWGYEAVCETYLWFSGKTVQEGKKMAFHAGRYYEVFLWNNKAVATGVLQRKTIDARLHANGNTCSFFATSSLCLILPGPWLHDDYASLFCFRPLWHNHITLALYIRSI